VIDILRKLYRALANWWRIRKIKKNSSVGCRVYVTSSAIIGKGCNIGDGVVIGKNVILGDGVVIGKGVFLERIHVNDNSILDSRVIILGHGDGKIVIGHDSYIGPDTALDYSDDLVIGDFVHIAGLSTGLWTHSSAKMCLNGIRVSIKDKKYRPTKPVSIENNVYIGGNCTIYPGVTIGHHSIIAPNSAVNTNTNPYSLYGGVPARYIKTTSDMVEQVGQ